MHFINILFVGMITLFNSQDPIRFKTAGIVNDAYIASNDWKPIPVDVKEGEDINSLKYGGIYFPPKTVDSGIREKRTTIARGLMEIEADLINNTDSEWLVDEVVLMIIEKYDTSPMDIDIGAWEVGARSSGYNPFFEIENGNKSISDIPDEVVIWPKEDMVDSRIILEVATAESIGNSKTVYEFNFTMTLSKIGDDDEKIEIKSDRNYFISSK